MKKNKFLLFIMALLFAATTQAQLVIFDNTFGTEGFVTTSVSNKFDDVRNVLQLSDGRILALSTFSVTNQVAEIGVICYTRDGELDKTFANNGILQMTPFVGKNFVLDAAELPDSKIILGGYNFNIASASTSMFLVKITNDGQVDQSFGNNGFVEKGGSGDDQLANKIKVQKDGKILVCGHRDFSFMLARFNANGSLDNTFGEQGYAKLNFKEIAQYTYGQDLAIQSDGKIVAVGFGSPSGNDKMLVTRVDKNGVLDNAYGPNGNGKIVVNVGFGHDFATCMTIQKDDKILIGGHSWYSNYPVLQYETAVVRLNTDGTFDDTFGKNGIFTKQVVPEIENYIYGIGIGDNDKIFAAGYSKSLNSVPSTIAISLNMDGTLNTKFAEEGTVSYLINSLATQSESLCIQDDGKLLIGGNLWDGKSSTCLVTRLCPDNGQVSVKPLGNISDVSIYPNPTADYINIDSKENFTAKIVDLCGRVVYTEKPLVDNRIDVSTLASGSYIVVLKSDKKTVVKNFIKM